VRRSEQTRPKKKRKEEKQHLNGSPSHAMETRGRGESINEDGSKQLMLTSPNAPLPITLTVLKSRKPIFVRRSLKNCDCVRVCLLISRIPRSSVTPARDLSSSAPLQSIICSSSSSSSNRARAERDHDHNAQCTTAKPTRQNNGSGKKNKKGHATHRMFKSIAVSSAKR
jgi:hypothetical protein